MAIAPLRPEGPSRDRLTRAALRLFAERGYDGVSNREIVAACGLTKGAIYWYFESKEDLFQTILAEAMTSFEHRVLAALEGEGSWEARLGAALRLFVAVLESDDDPHRDLLVLLVHRFPRGPGADRMVQATYALLVGWVERVLAEKPGVGISGRQAALLVHATGLGVLSQAASGRNVARATLGALYRVLGCGDLHPPEGDG